MQFSSWNDWPSRNQIGEILDYPGIYAIRFSSHTRVDNSPFQWSPEIIYIGMTNSAAGLKGRLNQFDETMRTSRVTHGGADRVRLKHQVYSRFARSAYVAVCHMVCDVSSNEPHDLRMMGKVAEWEYLALATYVEKFGRLPEFNDKKRTQKFSKRTSNKGMDVGHRPAARSRGR